ncbi:MAG: Conserved putative secreted protein [Thermoleophilia bacterium]|nr:Conserved putative secreted protein [Thermoleophilia bacterium]
MPPRTSPTVAIRHASKRSALLAMVLAGLAASLFAISVPKAAGGPDQVAPSAPTNLRVTGASQTAVTVEWAKSTDNVGVEGYRVTFGSSKYKTPETRFTASGLACGVSHSVQVRAYDHARNFSSTATAIVSSAPCLDMQAPTAPSGLQQIASGPTTATFAWSAATDNVAVAGYAVSRGGFELDTTMETSYPFFGLSCGRTYTVGVRAYDVAGNSSAWVSFYVTTSQCGDVSAPTAPTGLTQTDRTVSTMSLAWSASTDNVGVARYAVFRNGAELGSTTGQSYALSGLACATSYEVGVDAVDGAGNRSARASATLSTASCVTPPPPTGDTQPPSTPTNVSVASASTTSITLTWSPSTDNVGVTGYGVYRNGVRAQVVTGTTFVFQGLACGTAHDLGVEAYDAAGSHSGRAAVTASTSPCSDSSPPTTPQNLVLLSRTSTSITVSWSASTDNVGVAGYGAYAGGQLAGSTGTTTYTFTGLPCNTSQTFGVDAYDAAGNRSAKANVGLATAACGDTQPPTPPTQLNVSSVAQTSLTLSWSASSDNVGVAGYDLFSNGSKVATVTGTSHAFGNLACGTSYTLGVEAFDSAGNRSSRSTSAAATAQCSAPPPPERRQRLHAGGLLREPQPRLRRGSAGPDGAGRGWDVPGAGHRLAFRPRSGCTDRVSPGGAGDDPGQPDGAGLGGAHRRPGDGNGHELALAHLHDHGDGGHGGGGRLGRAIPAQRHLGGYRHRGDRHVQLGQRRRP